ncbi:hypothetical protein D3P08_02690 [Paenibacillus nanensis]|uniref:Uncharacterized protein n=1 Tax=Paenibacillus nanensis TaxID=393251 RepID=A0A3A1VPL0_9BACL|nr:hypothetical protein D3P08_02690 [Paenibacillus nanensis]
MSARNFKWLGGFVILAGVVLGILYGHLSISDFITFTCWISGGALGVAILAISKALQRLDAIEQRLKHISSVPNGGEDDE